MFKKSMFFRVMLSPDNGATAGAQPSTEEPKPDTDSGQQPSEPQPQEKTFKQEDVNNIVAREKKETTEKLLKDLGIEDFDNAKDGLAKFKAWQESQKTEAEKQAEHLKAIEAENLASKQRAEALEAKLTAVTKGVDPQYIDEVILLAQAQVKDDVTIDQAIDHVIEKFPTFKVATAGTKAPTFAKAGNPSKDDTPTGVVDAILAKYKK